MKYLQHSECSWCELSTAKLAFKIGGKVCMEAFDIPGVGRIYVLQDPQGVMINIIIYLPQSE